MANPALSGYLLPGSDWLEWVYLRVRFVLRWLLLYVLTA